MSRLTLRNFTLFLALFATLIVAQSDTNSLPKSITLSYQSLRSPSVKPLATIFYNPVDLKNTLSSWTPPTLDSLTSTSPEPTSPELLRILLPNGSSTLTSLATFNNSVSQSIDLHISPFDNVSILAASVTAHPPTIPLSSTLNKKATSIQDAQDSANVQVNLIPPQMGPYPKLNSRKPVVVGADGKERAADAEEKSFFQKYWWVFLLVAVFAMSGGGGDK